MTVLQPDPTRFFGLQPSRWPSQWRAAGALLLQWPLLRRLPPQIPVQLHRADGGASAWLLAQGQAQAQAQAAQQAQHPVQALELPAGLWLERRLNLPPLAAPELAQAVQLEVAAASPFTPGQTVFGYSPRRIDAKLTQVDIAITSRQQIEPLLSGFDAANPPEVWALPPSAGQADPITPIVLRGYGEGERERRVRQGLLRRLLLLALALALLAALVVTPTALLRARAQQGQQAFAALQKQSAPVQTQREALTQRLDLVRQVGRQLDTQLALPPVLAMLTRAVPDGAWLTSLRVEGPKIVLNGQADDAAALVQRLAAQPGVHDVRLASPATRPIGADKENFIIELKLDTKRYGPVLGPEGAPS